MNNLFHSNFVCDFNEPFICKNYKSALENSDKVDLKLRSEFKLGNYILCNEIETPKLVSALGAIQKPNGSVRLIHDASLPEVGGINYYASDTSCKYMDLKDACKIINQGDFLAKVDLSNAYRSVKVHSSNYPYTGLHWRFQGDNQDTFFYDTKVPFGAAQSPSIFQRLSSAVCRIMKSKYSFCVIAYLDDFLIIESTYDRCSAALTCLIQLLRKLGFYINWNKVEGPSQRLIFLGILIDTCKLTLSLPGDKLTEFFNLLCDFKGKHRASKKQIESLIGKLNWSCQVIKGGRTFLRRLLDLKHSLKGSQHKVILSDEFQKDLNWWIQFIHEFNGTVNFINNKPITNIQTDACNFGGGAFFNSDYFYINWKIDMPAVADFHINIKETVTLILALFHWHEQLRDKYVMVFTDNMTARSIINKGTCKSSYVMNLLRQLFWLQATFNFTVQAIFLPGKFNVLADCVSRLHEKGQLSKLWSLNYIYECGFIPFTLKELCSHMSPAFVFYRWGRASCKTV